LNVHATCCCNANASYLAGPFADVPPYNPLLNDSCSTADGDDEAHVSLSLIISATCGGCMVIVIIVVILASLIIKKRSVLSS